MYYVKIIDIIKHFRSYDIIDYIIYIYKYTKGTYADVLTTEFGSSVVEQWAGYPEVRGFDPCSDSNFQELSN